MSSIRSTNVPPEWRATSQLYSAVLAPPMCSAPVGEGANLTLMVSRFGHTSMLVGGHVSTSGGLVKAYERGVEFGCDALQIFNQSPRMWRPTQWKQDDIDEFRERMADGPIKSVVIHAVYLINAASNDPEIREKSLDSLAQALRVGDAIGADGVVFHPGSTVGEPLDESIDRVGEAIRHVLGESGELPAAARGHGRRRRAPSAATSTSSRG